MKQLIITIIRLPKWHVRVWTINEKELSGPDERVIDYFNFYGGSMDVYSLCVGAFTEKKFTATRVQAINNDGDGFELER